MDLNFCVSLQEMNGEERWKVDETCILCLCMVVGLLSVL